MVADSQRRLSQRSKGLIASWQTERRSRSKQIKQGTEQSILKLEVALSEHASAKTSLMDNLEGVSMIYDAIHYVSTDYPLEVTKATFIYFLNPLSRSYIRLGYRYHLRFNFIGIQTLYQLVEVVLENYRSLSWKTAFWYSSSFSAHPSLSHIAMKESPCFKSDQKPW